MNRRRFLQNTAVTASALAFPAILRSANPGAKLRIAVVGTSGRGTELASGFAGLSDSEVAYICDVDDDHAAKAAATVERKAGKAPQTARDFRTILDDKELDAVAIATPDHWHTPAALLALAAGKHVYVEKPCCHNPHEGEMLVAAAREHGRHVQHGTQRRSWPGVREAIEKLHSGAIGRVLSARAHYLNTRPTIGRGKEAPVIPGLDWSLWQGPAPERPFHDNYVHYNWHWFWHWGTGELGNNGVHMIDVCRWGLGVDFPRRVTMGGEKLRFPEDDQETPDTSNALFDFGGKTIAWENRSWASKTPNDPNYDCAFFGENGSLLINAGGYSIHDLKGGEIGKNSAPGGNDTHLQNFLDAIRGSAPLNAPIEEGYKSALLCHLGNIAWRTDTVVRFDQGAQKIIDNPAANKLWRREYQPGWEPKV